MEGIYCRFRDISYIEKLEAISKKRKVNKTALCREFCENGIDFEYERVMNIQPSSESDEILAPINSLLKELNESMKNIDINKEIQNSMLSVIYKILIAMVSKEIMDTKSVEDGMYDSLPLRFTEKLDALVEINKDPN